MNNIFDKLVKSKIEKFMNDYKNLSRQVFVDKNGKLIHPGEFGSYREEIIKNLIQPFLPTRLAVGSGFIITSKDNISTQCDIVIYDKDNTPIIENNEQRFFPIECVAAVIEVKSTLNKTQLKNALIKLSNIKNLRNDIASNNIYTYRDVKAAASFDTKYNFRDQIATFIICEKITGLNREPDIESFFKEIYNGIDKSLFHNMILSLNDGCLMYFNGKVPIYHRYFEYATDEFKNCLITPAADGYKYEHVSVFVNYFYMIISSVSIMYVEMTHYLGVQRKFSKRF